MEADRRQLLSQACESSSKASERYEASLVYIENHVRSFQADKEGHDSEVDRAEAEGRIRQIIKKADKTGQLKSALDLKGDEWNIAVDHIRFESDLHSSLKPAKAIHSTLKSIIRSLCRIHDNTNSPSIRDIEEVVNMICSSLGTLSRERFLSPQHTITEHAHPSVNAAQSHLWCGVEPNQPLTEEYIIAVKDGLDTLLASAPRDLQGPAGLLPAGLEKIYKEVRDLIRKTLKTLRRALRDIRDLQPILSPAAIAILTARPTFITRAQLCLQKALRDNDSAQLRPFLSPKAATAVYEGGISSLCVALCQGKASLEFFIDSGVTLDSEVALDAKDRDGFTVLHYAVLTNAVPETMVLLQHGANVNCQDVNTGSTPLHMVCLKPRTRYDVGKVLCWSGADWNIKDKKGDTPTDVLSRSPMFKKYCQESKGYDNASHSLFGCSSAK